MNAYAPPYPHGKPNTPKNSVSDVHMLLKAMKTVLRFYDETKDTPDCLTIEEAVLILSSALKEYEGGKYES